MEFSSSGILFWENYPSYYLTESAISFIERIMNPIRNVHLTFQTRVHDAKFHFKK